MEFSSTSIEEDDSQLSLKQVVDVDVSLLDLLFDKKDEIGPEVLNDPQFNSVLTPFELEWSFGFNVNVPILNLTTADRHLIFYAASHIGILYNYCTKSMIHLRAHQNIIASVSVDHRARWLATVDVGKDNVLLVWDITKHAPVFTIFDYPPPSCKNVIVAISHSAKFLVTVVALEANEEEAEDDQEKDESDSYNYCSDETVIKVNVWLWTHGSDKPDASYTCKNYPGMPKSIAFHPNKEEHFMVVFSKTVIFFAWNPDEAVLSESALHLIKNTAKLGQLSSCTYADYCHECFVSTLKGYILSYANSLYSKPYTEAELDNAKIRLATVKICRSAITCLKSTDGMVIACNADGHIYFLDKHIRLIYWMNKFKVDHIVSMSFMPTSCRYNLDKSTVFKRTDEDFVFIDCEVDNTEEFETLLKSKASLDASLERKPFFSRDFFISTMKGNIYGINFLKRQCKPMFSNADSPVAAIDVHDELPYIVIAYTSGRLILFNTETYEELVSTVLDLPTYGEEEHNNSYDDDNDDNDDDEKEQEPNCISTIKYSPESLHLACSTTKGDFYILQPVLLQPKQYIRPTYCKIKKIVFSKDNVQLAFYDVRMTLFAMIYDTSTSEWVLKGKLRTHYKTITNILFTSDSPPILYSIGEDRNLVEYYNLLGPEEFSIRNRDRVEQRDLPTYFICYPRKKFSKAGYFLLIDNMHKYKILNQKTLMCVTVALGPAYGCFRDKPVLKIKFLRERHHKYLVVMNDKHIGLQMLPLDGNPYRFIGCLGHPVKLLDFRVSADCNYVYTIGENDRNVLKWKIQLLSVDTLSQLGGEELQPYYCLIEGGKNGFLFREMQDLFYYMQILQQGENVPLPRFVSEHISITELPDLVRACGYYPSEYEIENMIVDIRYKEYDDTGMIKETISFSEFVKLYINHRPPHGYKLEALEEAFDKISTYDEEAMPGMVNRDVLIEEMTTSGEALTRENLHKCFVTLLGQKEDGLRIREDRDFNFLSDYICFDEFTTDILAIDMNHSNAEFKPKKDDDSNGEE